MLNQAIFAFSAFNFLQEQQYQVQRRRFNKSVADTNNVNHQPPTTLLSVVSHNKILYSLPFIKHEGSTSSSRNPNGGSFLRFNFSHQLYGSPL